MRFPRSPLLLAFCTLAALLSSGVTGCGSSDTSSNAVPLLQGNWAFSEPAGATSSTGLRLNAGFTPNATGKGTVAGMAHLAGNPCVGKGTNIALSGSITSAGSVRLISVPFGGTTLTLRGKLSPDGKSLTNASYAFSGGSCASLASGTISGVQYASIAGTYAGTFTNAHGEEIPVSAALTQTSQPDANGQFHLAGSASFSNTACFAPPVLTDSVVTGSSLLTTYTATANGQTVTITASGTFNADATQLSIASWLVAGGLCDGSAGTGLLTRQ